MSTWMLSVARRLRLRLAHPFGFPCRAWSSSQVRTEFIRYFEERDHLHIPSSSVLPEDESLLFTTAGMNQFKPIFIGNTADSRWNNLQKAVSYQKCIRAGGKHNDLDDVGKDFHHQTFFEMLGNWSFNGAYSKETACKLAWNFLVDVMKIDPDRLYVTYFSGGFGIPADLECKEIWRKIGVPVDRILPFQEENFWEMGFVGPCGMCTEIHYDRVPGRGNVAQLVNSDNSVVELWNIVFMCLNRDVGGSLKHLPNEHIDTGMGFERLVSVVQGVDSNFDTDLFRPLIQKLSKDSVLKYKGTLSPDDSAFRLVADHIRAATVAISDGALPSGSGAGFVVRKILRRAFLQSTNTLKMERGACVDLVPLVVSSLKDGYPSLETAFENIQRVISDDETQFWKIVDRGKRVFDEMLPRIPLQSKIFPGGFIWTLHDTHGVPVDVTAEMARDAGKEVDLEGYDKLKKEAKDISKLASSFTAGIQLNQLDFPSHSDRSKYKYSIGKDEKYEFPAVNSKILSSFASSSKGYTSVFSISGKGAVILEDCQFYAEEGGQKSDEGVLLGNDGKVVFVVENVQKVDGITVIYGSALSEIAVGSTVTQKINTKRRCALMRAHSATHLLNWAVRRVGCGEGQRGSAVSEDTLRFDYATGETAGEEGIMEEVEQSILRVISEGRPVFSAVLPQDRARRLPQLQSEFRADKVYAENIRVISVGSADLNEAFASEACSGTHVLNTKSIGDFVITGDRSSAKGVRRVTALCGEKAKDAREYANRLVNEVESCDEKDLEPIRKSVDWSRVPYSMSMRLNQLLKKKKKSSKKRAL